MQFTTVCKPNRVLGHLAERIEWLVDIGVDRHPIGLNDVLVRRFAHRLAARSPSLSARIKEPARTLEVGSFLRYCLLTATDQLILMFQRRVADLWRQSADGGLGDVGARQCSGSAGPIWLSCPW